MVFSITYHTLAFKMPCCWWPSILPIERKCEATNWCIVNVRMVRHNAPLTEAHPLQVKVMVATPVLVGPDDKGSHTATTIPKTARTCRAW